MLRCLRGSNPVEGYHQHIIRSFGAWNAGLRLTDAFLADHRHRWSLRAAHKNRGVHDPGHYDSHLIDQIVNLQIEIYGRSKNPSSATWRSAWNFAPSSETFGVPKLVGGEDARWGIKASSDQHTAEMSPDNVWTAARQGTGKMSFQLYADHHQLRCPPLIFPTHWFAT